MLSMFWSILALAGAIGLVPCSSSPISPTGLGTSPKSLMPNKEMDLVRRCEGDNEHGINVMKVLYNENSKAASAAIHVKVDETQIPATAQGHLIYVWVFYEMEYGWQWCFRETFGSFEGRKAMNGTYQIPVETKKETVDGQVMTCMRRLKVSYKFQNESQHQELVYCTGCNDGRDLQFCWLE